MKIALLMMCMAVALCLTAPSHAEPSLTWAEDLETGRARVVAMTNINETISCPIRAKVGTVDDIQFPLSSSTDWPHIELTMTIQGLLPISFWIDGEFLHGDKKTRQTVATFLRQDRQYLIVFESCDTERQYVVVRDLFDAAYLDDDAPLRR